MVLLRSRESRAFEDAFEMCLASSRLGFDDNW